MTINLNIIYTATDYSMYRVKLCRNIRRQQGVIWQNYKYLELIKIQSLRFSSSSIFSFLFLNSKCIFFLRELINCISFSRVTTDIITNC